MRLFVALEVPEVPRREVRRRLSTVRDRLPRAKWVAPDNLHLTLVFLGEVEPARLPALEARLAEAFAPFPPLDLRLSGGGTFPPGRPARVAWVGVDAPRSIRDLQRAVEAAAVEVVGIEPEGRPYHPHVTLARCPEPWRRDSIEKLARALTGEIGPPFVADRGVLVESRLGQGGARYRVVQGFPLAGTSPLAGVLAEDREDSLAEAEAGAGAAGEPVGVAEEGG